MGMMQGEEQHTKRLTFAIVPMLHTQHSSAGRHEAKQGLLPQV